MRNVVCETKITPSRSILVEGTDP